ncbi:hypothetical protein NA57DRAFT_42155 [Rhizodiscina lignyota]|uniref:Uncharacterized protein n=1 Tax=Rhizodiscina lignyota TaxID=1504668 RepID=A0A9P4ICA3_9PEZI|nr:hypothetical protein NA57DRAFT_42155 [Rhizodiscina lignyota]
MASRILFPASRALVRTNLPNIQRRPFSQSRTLAQEASPAPARKPVGAFRGGLFGFLLGSTLAGAGMYYYVLDEYKVSNELLTEDIYTLHAAVQRTEAYIQSLEEKVATMEKKK